MRRIAMCSLMLSMVAGFAWSQAITDVAGAVAGGSVGVGAGKKVSDGISNVLTGVRRTTAKAARNNDGIVLDEKPAAKPAERPAGKPAERAGDGAGNSGGTVLQTSPGGVVKDHSLVPPPPPKKVAVVPPPPPLPVAPAVFQPVVVLPPPRQVTVDDLKTIASGMRREEVLKLGPPASRISMFDDGHLVEIFRYQTRDTTLGVVHLSDGTVLNVQMR